MASPTIWDEDFRCFVHAAHIADPTGGATNDAESRTAINAILAALRAARIIGRDATATVEEQTPPAVWDADRGSYVRAAAIASPSGGATQDAELRTAVGQVLTALRKGLVIVHTAAAGNPDVYDEDVSSYAFSAYTTPTGGTTTDAEGRAQLNLAATAMKSAGLLTND